tara:strand:+ start:660 stop:1553 length:894 start_codon:yes stop_codon:yes gene_type:complete
MARCLVTGHRGYIGTHLFGELKKQGHDVMGVDLFEGHDVLDVLKEYREPMEGRFHPHFSGFKPEYIFHLACIPRVAYSVEHPVETMKNNVLCTSHVLNFARKVGTKRVIYSGSSSVVGNGDGPTSPYGLQKLISEMECKLYSELYGVDTVTLRYFNVYSEDQKAEGPYATAISNWMKFIREGKIPFITGDGNQRRDMLHVSDAVSANIFAMNSEEPFCGSAFDTGTGTNISLNEVRGVVNEYFPEIEFDYVEERPGDVMFTKANTSPLAQRGWTAKVSVKDGINSCFKNLKKELENE